jgi:HEAT repeat protein
MGVFQLQRSTGELPEPDKQGQYLPAAKRRSLPLVAMTVGIAVAFLVCFGGSVSTVWGKITSPFSLKQDSDLSSTLPSDADLKNQEPQEQAELLLERALSHTSGTAGSKIDAQIEDKIEVQIEAQIQARIDAWRGQLKWDTQLGNLTTVALNSNDRSVRNSAVEVQLAAYGLPKSDASVEALVRQADSRDHTKKIWALWALGLLGNRGIETDRVVEVLTSQLRSSGENFKRIKSNEDTNNEDTRRWAVEALALVGTTPTVTPLLEAMRNDVSASVRERAACSLAQSGMLSHQQRLIAVPRLIDYSGDTALDAQTRAWAFQALAEITRQRLPNDSAAWRNWYQTHGPED